MTLAGYIDFPTGRAVHVDVIRYGEVPVPALARMAGYDEVDPFLADLDRWATSAGIPYGITVDRAAQAIATPPR